MPASTEHKERVLAHLEAEERAQISGRQRLRNVRTKTKIVASRQFREFMAGKLDTLPCIGDELDTAIAREFESIAPSPTTTPITAHEGEKRRVES